MTFLCKLGLHFWKRTDRREWRTEASHPTLRKVRGCVVEFRCRNCPDEKVLRIDAAKWVKKEKQDG